MRSIAVELFKFRRQPLMRNVLLAALLLTVIGIAMYGIVTRAEAAPGVDLGDRQVQRQMFGTGSANIVIAVVALLGIAGEYRHGTISTTFLTRPSRAQTIYAKLAAYSLVAVLYGVAAAALATGAGLAVLATEGVGLELSGTELVSDFERDVVGLVLYAGYGLAIGGVLANQVAGIIVLFGETLVSEVVGFALPEVAKFLPGQAAASLLSEQPSFSRDALSTTQGGLVFLAYVVFGIAVAILMTRRRDIA